jgi:alkaline phosphatase D
LARRELDRLDVAVRTVPGNHDVGDNPVPESERMADRAISSQRIDQYRATLGRDHWRVDLPGWRLLGLNCLLFGSRLDAAADQWRWLVDEVAELADLPVAPRLGLVLHKPLGPTPLIPHDSTPGRYVSPASRAALVALVREANCRLVVSGHCHQFSHHVDDGVTYVWVPSTWAVIPDRYQPRLGDKICGLVELRLGDDGGLRVQLIQPAGFRHHVLGDTIADPYEHATPTPRG